MMGTYTEAEGGIKTARMSPVEQDSQLGRP